MPFWKTDLPSLPKKEKPQKIPKPIPKISEKKKKRLKDEWSETELFLEIWWERSHSCVDCGKILNTPKAHNFDHRIPKSAGKKYRMDKSNIDIVCFADHFKRTTGLNYKWIDLDL